MLLLTPNRKTDLAIRSIRCRAGQIAFALLVAVLVSWSSVQCRELIGIKLVCGPTQSLLDLTFSNTTSEEGFPSFFQKVDSTKGILTLSFLETETAFPLGRHIVDSGSRNLEAIQLRKMTSPSGKNFLGLELQLKEPPSGEAPIQPGSRGSLQVVVGKGTKKKFTWSLAKALKAKEEYLTAKASNAPVEKVEMASMEKPDTAKAVSMPSPVVNKNPTKSSPIDTAKKEPTKNLKGEPPVLVKSAHELGAALDAKHGAKQGINGLSSSKVFSIGLGSKPMIVVKDSIEMKDQAGIKGKLLKKLPLGLKVVRIDGATGWTRLVAEADTGFVRTEGLLYSDEMTSVQEKSLSTKLEAKQAKLTAWEAKVAAQKADSVAKAEKKAAQVAAKAEELRKKTEAAALALQKKNEAMHPMPKDSVKQPEVKAMVSETIPPATAVVGETKTPALKVKPPKSVASAETPKDTTHVPGNTAGAPPKLAIADSPELAEKLAREKKQAEEEKMRIEPEEKRVTYNSYGRRDPFIPVEAGSTDNGIDIDQMKVVGIIWQSSEPLAVLEHVREANVSFTVKQGDPVHNGRVARITREAVTFDISEYGISRSYSLKLVSSKEGTKK